MKSRTTNRVTKVILPVIIAALLIIALESITSCNNPKVNESNSSNKITVINTNNNTIITINSSTKTPNPSPIQSPAVTSKVTPTQPSSNVNKTNTNVTLKPSQTPIQTTPSNYSFSNYEFTIDCTKSDSTSCFAGSDTSEGWSLGLVDRTLFNTLVKKLKLNPSTETITYKSNLLNNRNPTEDEIKIINDYRSEISLEVLNLSNSIRNLVSSSVIDTTTNINSGIQFLKLIPYTYTSNTSNINNTNSTNISNKVNYVWSFSYGPNKDKLTTVLISFDGKKIIQ